MSQREPASLQEAAEDVRTMRVRGAAAIARHAVAGLAAWERETESTGSFDEALADACARLLETRPTAVSLRNALLFVQARVSAADDADAKRAALRDAVAEFDARARDATVAIGRHARRLVEDGGTYLTHCNSQAALAGFRAARADGAEFRVLCTETRPWRQGYLTARQLADAGVDVTLIVDSAAASALDEVDAVFTGCDTIAANGDVVNKVGTRGIALAAREAGAPVYTCGESFKVALDVPRGAAVVIEERDAAEVTGGEALAGVKVRNPVFDVTPRDLVTSIVTEAGPAAPGDVADVARKAWRL